MAFRIKDLLITVLPPGEGAPIADVVCGDTVIWDGGGGGCDNQYSCYGAISRILWFFRKLDDDTCGILKERRDPSDKTLPM